MIWSREDANENLLLGSPSYKVEISNKSSSVTVKNPENDLAVVTSDSHGLSTGDIISIETTLETVSIYDSTSASISVVDDDTYTYRLSVTPDEPLDSATAVVKLNRAKVTVEFSVPDGISAEKGDKYEIYRTFMQPLANDIGFDPGTGDDMFRVTQKKITAAEVAAKKVTFEDVVEQLDLDALALYTLSLIHI